MPFPSTYPATLDSFPVTRADATLMFTNHKDDHNWLGDALNKVEAELGVNPRGTYATVAARLAALANPSSTGNLTFTSDSDTSGGGDIVFVNGATEAARFTGGKLGIGLTSGLAAPLHVRIPGTGSIALFEPGGGGAQYYHFNELGLGAVGDNVNLPYIAVENNTAQDIKLQMSVTNAAGNLAQLAATSVSGVSTPSLKLYAPSGDVYVQPGTSTLNKNIRLWCGITGQAGNSHVTIAKQDGSGIVFDVSPNLQGLSFFGAGVASKQTVTGSRGANAALASLLTALGTYGLITDSSTI